jgi:hypothetical protein
MERRRYAAVPRAMRPVRARPVLAYREARAISDGTHDGVPRGGVRVPEVGADVGGWCFAMKRTKADADFSDVIRARDGWKCQRCGQQYNPHPGPALASAHCFGRGKPRTRFDEDNACALCFGCHRWLDTHPPLKEAFFRERLGDERYEALQLRSNGG